MNPELKMMVLENLGDVKELRELAIMLDNAIDAGNARIASRKDSAVAPDSLAGYIEQQEDLSLQNKGI